MMRAQMVVTSTLIATGLVWAVAARSSDRLPVAPPIVVTSAYTERSDRVRPNETLSNVFARHQIVGTDLLAVLRVADGLNPRRVPVGMTFEFRYPVGVDRADRVRTRITDDAFLVLTRDSTGEWISETERISWTVHTERLSGDIRVSLDAAIRRLIPDSVLPNAQRQQLAWAIAGGVFPWIIDFTRDIYQGDQVDVLYERLVSSIGEVKFGRVLAARLQSRGRPQIAYLFEDPDGTNAYYDEAGRSLRRAFKVYPVEFRRISSGFNRARLHPVLRTRRPHLGVDYAASRGAPVEATGDGTVIRANWWGGYGNVVVVRHAQGIETRYAHLTGFARGIAAGVRVRQGQIIGFVGMTGLASGPHVHYEFLQNGAHVDPRRVDMGDGTPVPRARMAAFEAARARYDRYLPHRSAPQRVD